jgi:tetratricopeptide (TPR) repeat protein
MFQPPRVSPPGITHTRRGLSHTNSVDNFGDVLKDMGRYEEALVHMQKALDIQIKLLGSEKDLVALSYLNICELRMHEGKYEETLEMFSKSLEINTQVFGSNNHPEIADIKELML